MGTQLNRHTWIRTRNNPLIRRIFYHWIMCHLRSYRLDCHACVCTASAHNIKAFRALFQTNAWTCCKQFSAVIVILSEAFCLLSHQPGATKPLATDRIRTHNLLLTRELLWRLSYDGLNWIMKTRLQIIILAYSLKHQYAFPSLEWMDLNHRHYPHGSLHAFTMPCRYALPTKLHSNHPFYVCKDYAVFGSLLHHLTHRQKIRWNRQALIILMVACRPMMVLTDY